MAIRIHKRVFDLLRDFAVFFLLAFMDKSYFLPLQSHSDLKFQAVGESLELFVLAGMLFLLPIVLKRSGVSETTALTLRSRFLAGGCVSFLLFVLFWRDFFPDDRFSLAAGKMDFLYGPAFAVMVVAITYILGPHHQNFDKANRSVA